MGLSPKRCTLKSGKPLMILAGLLLMTSWSSPTWAKDAGISTLDYLTSGVLAVRGATSIAAPRFEFWPGGNENQPVVTVILNFPGTVKDLNSLQQVANQLKLSHPELQQLLVTHEQPENREESLQIVLQATLKPGIPHAEPTLHHGSNGEWRVFLDGGAAELGLPPLGDLPSQEAAAPEPSSTPKSHEGKPKGSHLPVIKIGKKREPEVLQIKRQQEIQGLAHELQAVINQRDELESTVARLNAELAQSNPKSFAQNTEASPCDDLIREYLPDVSNSQMRETVVIQNLRTALTKLALKLKATEKALETQTAKTRSLATELAEIKKDPSILQDPSLVALVLAEPEESPGKHVAHTQARQQTVAIRKQFHYKPVLKTGKTDDHSVKMTLSKAAFKEQEILLQASIRENPKNTDSWLRLADLYASRNELAMAESVITRLLKENPRFGEGYYYLSLLYLGENRPLEAQVALETYRRSHPEDIDNIRAVDSTIKAALQAAGGGKRATGSAHGKKY